MIQILINGRTINEWIHQKVKDTFCRREIPRGRILVAWRDVDDMVYGWTLSADEETELFKVAQLIAITKHKKLIHIIAGKEQEGR